MKFMCAAILGVALVASVCFAGEKPDLKDLKDKESYSLGYQFGQSVKDQGVDINPEIYSSGLHDALSGASPRLSQDEIRDTVTELQKRVTAARQKEMKESMTVLATTTFVVADGAGVVLKGGSPYITSW